MHKYLVRIVLSIIAVLMISVICNSQVGGGYIVYQEIDLPDENITLPIAEFTQAFNRFDVKALGMGKTQVALGTRFNAMMYNPALLSHKRFAFDLIGFQMSVPMATIDAAKFVKDNSKEFGGEGTFMRLIKEGYQEYEDASTPQEKISAIRKLNQGLKFPNELLNETIGSQENPNIHGVNVLPNIQVQWGNWGVSVYGNAQIGFQIMSGETIDNLLSIQIPENAQDLSIEALKELATIVESVFDEQGNISSEGLPQVFALTYIDIVGAIGHSYPLKENLHVGTNLKVINRRFTSKNLDANGLQDVITEARKDMEESITGVTLDLGALYHHEATGLDIGFSLQNLIPIQTLSSTAEFHFVNSEEFYLTDNNGEPLVGFVDDQDNFYADPQGDTLLYIENTKQNIRLPIELKAPLLANLGVRYPIRENWDACLEWADMFSQDVKYEDYSERFRIGTEYRLLKSILALRAGIADKRITAGLGLNLKILQIDAAYAYDNFIGDEVAYIQLKLGW